METAELTLEQQIWAVLAEVKDPEIPTISVVDLGIISGVELSKDRDVLVRMTPTFTACPATEYMRDEINEKLSKLEGVSSARVELDFSIPWTSDKISEKGRQDLKDFGYAPPVAYTKDFTATDISNVSCPYCDSTNTSLNNIFGPALCRLLSAPCIWIPWSVPPEPLLTLDPST